MLPVNTPQARMSLTRTFSLSPLMDSNKDQTFTVRSALRKKFDLTTTGEDMRPNMKTSAARRNNADPKGKRKLRVDRFTRNKNTRREPKRSPTGGRQRDLAP